MIAIHTTPWSRAYVGPELADRLAEIRGPIGTPVVANLNLFARSRRGPFQAQYIAHGHPVLTVERRDLADAVEAVLALAEVV